MISGTWPFAAPAQNGARSTLPPRSRRTATNEEPGRLRAGSAGHTCAVTGPDTCAVTGPGGTGSGGVIMPLPRAEKDPSCCFQDRVARLHPCGVAIQDLIGRKNMETTGTLRPGGPHPASLRGAAR